MVILKSQNKSTDFFMILAWASLFNENENNIPLSTNSASWLMCKTHKKTIYLHVEGTIDIYVIFEKILLKPGFDPGICSASASSANTDVIPDLFNGGATSQIYWCNLNVPCLFGQDDLNFGVISGN